MTKQLLIEIKCLPYGIKKKSVLSKVSSGMLQKKVIIEKAMKLRQVRFKLSYDKMRKLSVRIILSRNRIVFKTKSQNIPGISTFITNRMHSEGALQ